MTRKSHDRQAGFALVESIAVLALSGLVLLTLVIASDLVSRNSTATARTANALETLAVGFKAVRRDFEGVRFIRIGTDAKDPILFSGAPQAVALVVADDGSGKNEGESLVLIEARFANGIGTLIRSSAQLQPGAKGFGGVRFANQAVLLSGPWRYKLAYGEIEEGSLKWREAWTAPYQLPEAIRLEVTGNSGNQIAPPLVVRLYVDSGGCADPARAECAAAQEAAPEGENGNQNPDQNPNPNPDPNNPGDGSDQSL
jgi:general secretion pathway protein J